MNACSGIRNGVFCRKMSHTRTREQKPHDKCSCFRHCKPRISSTDVLITEAKLALSAIQCPSQNCIYHVFWRIFVIFSPSCQVMMVYMLCQRLAWMFMTVWHQSDQFFITLYDKSHLSPLTNTAVVYTRALPLSRTHARTHARTHRYTNTRRYTQAFSISHTHIHTRTHRLSFKNHACRLKMRNCLKMRH